MTHAGARGRGFALPMVALLAMVGAIMIAVMLERQAAQQHGVNRRVARYGVHHTGRHVREVDHGSMTLRASGHDKPAPIPLLTLVQGRQSSDRGKT